MEKKENREFRVNLVDILITIVIAGVITFGAFMLASAFGVDTAEKTDHTISARSRQFRASRMSRTCLTRRQARWSPPYIPTILR